MRFVVDLENRYEEQNHSDTDGNGSVCYCGVCCCAVASSQALNKPSTEPCPKKSPEAKTESSAVEAGEDAGDYTVISSIEFGYRGLEVDR